MTRSGSGGWSPEPYAEQRSPRTRVRPEVTSGQLVLGAPVSPAGESFHVFDHARAEDKSTSIEAARVAKLTAGSKAALIHEDLVENGSSTASEVAQRHPEWNPSTISRRLTDLERAGRVRDTGRKRASVWGVPSTIYEVVDS